MAAERYSKFPTYLPVPSCGRQPSFTRPKTLFLRDLSVQPAPPFCGSDPVADGTTLGTRYPPRPVARGDFCRERYETKELDFRGPRSGKLDPHAENRQASNKAPRPCKQSERDKRCAINMYEIFRAR